MSRSVASTRRPLLTNFTKWEGSILKTKAIHEAIAKSGTSILEAARRIGVPAFQLEAGWVNLTQIMHVTGLSIEEIEELGRP